MTDGRVAQEALIEAATSNFAGEVLSFGRPGLSRGAIDVTHLGVGAAGANEAGNMEFIPSKRIDAGELTMQVLFNPEYQPPIGADAETWTITFPAQAGEATGAKWACSGFITGYEADGPEDDKMVATITIKLTGKQTFTAAVAS